MGYAGDGVGVRGRSETGIGVDAVSQDGTGLAASSTTGEAVHAETHSPGMSAIAAYNSAPNGTGAAIYAKKEGSIGHAGFFDGEVHVSRNLTVAGDVVLTGGDCAEDFPVAEDADVEPGTVMVVGPGGLLEPSSRAYDKRVAGVVSGAGTFRPGIVLDRQPTDGRRFPIAMLGKVYCKVDSSFGAVEIGDLLTTSVVPGFAMKATDQTRSFGAVIGKALIPLLTRSL